MRTSTRVQLVFILSLSLLTEGGLAAESVDALAESARVVREICRGGDSDGRNFSLEVDGSGNVNAIVLRKLIEAGLDGRIVLNKNEWSGIEPLMQDPEQYNKCLEMFQDVILHHIEPKEPGPDDLSNATPQGTIDPIRNCLCEFIHEDCCEVGLIDETAISQCSESYGKEAVDTFLASIGRINEKRFGKNYRLIPVTTVGTGRCVGYQNIGR